MQVLQGDRELRSSGLWSRKSQQASLRFLPGIRGVQVVSREGPEVETIYAPEGRRNLNDVRLSLARSNAGQISRRKKALWDGFS